MLPLLLIIILSLFVYYSINVMLKRGHDMHAIAFFSLYIYTVFTQVGYAYFPDFSILIGAYYGPMLFYNYWAFMFLSFVLSFLLYKHINPANNKRYFYIVKNTKQKHMNFIFICITVVLYIILTLYFSNNRDMFGYGGGTPMGSSLFGIGFWVYTICILILYTLIRENTYSNAKRIISLIVFIPCIIFFFKVSIASGVRGTLLYFFVAIACYELCPFYKILKFNKSKIIISIFVAIYLFNILSTLREIRILGEEINFSSLSSSYEIGESQFSNQSLQRKILMQDYYNPSHTLFISMHYGIIDPIEVIKSNFANSLIKLKYPYLTTMIVGEASGQTFDRAEGWAYHYFVEGYNALGFIGIFYNAIFWNFGMILWIRLTQSNNNRHNKQMLPILGLVIIITMRGQTSQFIQFYWLILLPGLILLMLANNSIIIFRKGKNP